MRPSAATLRLAAFGAALLVALLFILTFQFIPGRYQLTEGDVSQTTIKSPIKVTYQSQIRTRDERQRAAAAVSELYIFDAAIVDAQRAKLGEAIKTIGDARRPPTGGEPRRDLIQAAYNPPLRPGTIDELLGLTDG